ncbi:hypothetical protein Taro_001113, partial [Colocasia esculenta]|nr:hypothetical protein [Colocasia esculenta]
PQVVVAHSSDKSQFFYLVLIQEKMSLFTKFNGLAPKAKNMIVAGGLTSFVLGVYFYTMRAVGGTDELQVAIDKFEGMKKKTETE